MCASVVCARAIVCMGLKEPSYDDTSDNVGSSTSFHFVFNVIILNVNHSPTAVISSHGTLGVGEGAWSNWAGQYAYWGCWFVLATVLSRWHVRVPDPASSRH